MNFGESRKPMERDGKKTTRAEEEEKEIPRYYRPTRWTPGTQTILRKKILTYSVILADIIRYITLPLLSTYLCGKALGNFKS